MQTYDILMLAIVLAATLWGAWKGFAWQVASLAAIIASYLVAFRFRRPVADQISLAEPWNLFVAMLVLYVGTSAVIWIGCHLVREFIDRVKLKEFDRQMGAVFGLAKGVALCLVITLFAVTLLGDEQRQRIVHSRSGYYIAVLLDRSHTLMPKEVHEVLAPYLRRLDEAEGAVPDSMPGGAGATRGALPGFP